MLCKFDLSLLEIQDFRQTTNLSSLPSLKKKNSQCKVNIFFKELNTKLNSYYISDIHLSLYFGYTCKFPKCDPANVVTLFTADFYYNNR